MISSIGSIPEPIPGIPTRGELFHFVDWDLGRLEGRPTVFSAGNIVTGKGNIVASRKHSREVTATMVEAFLGIGENGHDGEEGLADAARAAATAQGERVANAIAVQPPIADDTLASIRTRVAERQQTVGYQGDYAAWIEKVTPPDLE